MVSVLLVVPFRCMESQPAESKNCPAAHWLWRLHCLTLGKASWFCFNSSPWGCGWSSFSGHSWSSPGLIGRSLGQRVGAGRGGAEGWRKCLLSQVTRGADASTHEGPWAPGQRLGDNPPHPHPSNSLAGPLKLTCFRSIREAHLPTNQEDPLAALTLLRFLKLGSL